MGMHGNYDLHTGFRGADEMPEPLDVFTEGDEDGYVWPTEPVLPLDECDDKDEAAERAALRRQFEDWEEAAAIVERAEREHA